MGMDMSVEPNRLGFLGDSQQQPPEQIMARAQTLGLDPGRVARALAYGEVREREQAEEPRERRRFGRVLARRFNRSS
jgi:2-hydroxychromene-2-carboxylate isomerase